MNKRTRTGRYIAVAVLLICIGTLAYSYWPASNAMTAEISSEDPVYELPHEYGFDPDSFDIDNFQLQPNEFLGDILAARGVDYMTIAALARIAEDTFSVRRLRPGKNCALVRKKGTGYVDCFVYEPNAFEYVVYHLYDDPRVAIEKREVDTCIETATGTLHASLWQTMYDAGHPVSLISRMEDALAWSVSFYHVDKGDKYKLIYERKYIDGVPVGVGTLRGASFYTGGKEVRSVYFETDKYHGYFDADGRPMKRAFLKSPVRYSHISSRYSNRRFHPVLKRYKGHFGTDYAAERGSPIMAVADGTITKAGYTKGNGNYVKMRHDRTYETQYLHMSKFAKGIKPGVHVSQGDVIGYVGSTGLATGPHVCFRFWKNGQQVDHLRENLPPPEPMPDEILPAYQKVRDEITGQLDLLTVQDLSLPST